MQQRVPSVERFFQFSLLGLVASAFCALADTGRLDLPSLIFLLAGVCWRGLMVAGLVQLRIPQHLITALATSYLVFYPIDFYFISHDFFLATAHGVCFFGVARVLSARTNRDYLYTGSVAFVALMGAAALSTQIRFFLWLGLAILCGIAVLTSAEIRRGYQRNTRTVSLAGARTSWRLAFLVASAGLGILVLTAGLFFIVPRTARAAAMMLPHGPRLTGFTNFINLGGFGPIAKDDRPVLHIRAYREVLPPNLKWRGSALSDFDGKRWSERRDVRGSQVVEVHGMIPVADQWQLSRRDGPRLLYRVDVNNAGTGALFIAGVPEFINVDAPTLMRTPDDAFVAFTNPGESLGYEVSAQNGAPLPYPLLPGDRRRDLRLPAKLDPRIPIQGRMWAGVGTDLERATRIQDRLRREFTYSLDTGIPAGGDPLADFLFVTKKGYCEYFASAMAVMLRTQDIPSRVATGFQSGYYNDVSGEWVMRASDAHAWVEGWIEGRGWLTFDPTPPGPANVSSGWLSRMNMYLDAADTAWQRWIVAYNPAQQVALAFAFRNKLNSLGKNGNGFAWPTLTAAGVWTSCLLATVVLAAFLRIFGPRLWRRWNAGQQIRRIRAGEGTPSDARLLYERMLETLARRGFQKPAWFTPAEFARTLPAGERERVGEFTATYNEVRFGGDSAAGAQRLAQMLDSLEARQS
jgi:hypothetical protein